MEINLSAINQKNRTVGQNAEDARFVITLLLTICALLGFTFVYNFPGYIANPVRKLTEGIKAISGKQYKQRIHLDRTDEFGEMAAAFNQMAEELDKYEHSNLAKILFEKQRAETVINSLRDASIGIDNNGRVLFANPLALKLLNLTEAAVLGKKINLIAEQNDLLRFLLNEKNKQPFKIVLENREQFFSKETVDINNNENTIGSMIVLRNITPYKELDVAKTNFIATVSHELKTPLASSDFSLKLLEDGRIGPLNTEQQQLVQNIRENNRRLLKILSELLDLSQVESGRLQLNITAVQPKMAIQHAMNAVKTSLEQKKIDTKITVSENLPAVLADEEKITWVLINFLTNAIKYSPEGSTIQVSVNIQEQSLLFEVTDHGKGIAQEHLDKIFDRYYQVPGTEKSGTGLGLSICKEFIEAMNGKIGVQSEEKKGSRFFFTLPAKTSNN
jgi:signal transduction histidine kinase